MIFTIGRPIKFSVKTARTSTFCQFSRALRQEVAEADEIRAMHVTVAGHALHEIQSAVPSVVSEPELRIHTR